MLHQASSAASTMPNTSVFSNRLDPLKPVGKMEIRSLPPLLVYCMYDRSLIGYSFAIKIVKVNTHEMQNYNFDPAQVHIHYS